MAKTTAERVMDREDALARGQQLVREIRAILAKAKAKKRRDLAGFDEDEHPRDEFGRFMDAGAESVRVGGRDILVTHGDRARRAGDVLVPIDVEKFDREWAREKDFHIDPTGKNKIGTRLERVRAFLKTSNQMDAAEVFVDHNGGVNFIDGRHRMAVLRDAGLKRVPVSMTTESLANARKAGLVAEKPY